LTDHQKWPRTRKPCNLSVLNGGFRLIFRVPEYRLDVVSTRLSAAEQFEAATEAARRGLGGGKVYDLFR
jgi:hypothetical protein